MPIYQTPNLRKITVQPQDRFNDQVILTGVDQQYLVPNGVFFLEFLEANAPGVTISDGAGNVMANTIELVYGDYSPWRCNGGIVITGTIVQAKGFVLRNVL